jgi:hypothetical protein
MTLNSFGMRKTLSLKNKNVLFLDLQTTGAKQIEESESPILNSWTNLSIDIYDRMTVLLAELTKLHSQKHSRKNMFIVKRL